MELILSILVILWVTIGLVVIWWDLTNYHKPCTIITNAQFIKIAFAIKEKEQHLS